jgi:hypothetical protein
MRDLVLCLLLLNYEMEDSFLSIWFLQRLMPLLVIVAAYSFF